MPENLTSSGPGIAGTIIKVTQPPVAGQTGLANKSPFVTDSMSAARVPGSLADIPGRLVSAWFLAYYGESCVPLTCPPAEICNTASPC